MATKKTNKKVEAEVTASADAEIKSPAEALADELVAEASIEATLEEKSEEVKEEPKKTAPKSSENYSSTITVMNTCYNEIYLNGGKPELSVRIAPKEVKTISRALYRELMKVQVIRNWFDKGILATSRDANETSAHEAKTPENLKNPVERTDAVSTVSASVTKFKKEGSVQINL